MKKENKKKYCCLKPEFPKEAFALIIFLKRDEEIFALYPLLKIYPSISFLTEKLEKEVLKIEKNLGMESSETAVLLPLSFQSLYPLKEKYWQKPEEHYDFIDRMRMFLKAAEQPGIYKLLVTPSAFNKVNKKWILYGALPVMVGTSDNEVEKFMLNSDWPVEKKAKYAAFYTFGKPLRFNFKTGEISETEKLNRGETVIN